MKKLLFMVLAGMFLIGLGRPVFAENYSVVLTTYQVGSNTTTFAANFPNIVSGLQIRKLVFESTNAFTTPVLIRVYNNATSTTAAAAGNNYGYWVLVGTNAVDGNNRLEVDYPKERAAGLFYTDPGFYSDTLQATVKVYMTIIYE